VRERRRDLVLVEVLGARLDVGVVELEPLVVVRGDVVAEDVHVLGLAAEGDRELLGEEHARVVGDLERAGDRVVIGDRHEVHAAAGSQLEDVLRRGRTLGQPQRGLHAELGHRRGGGVAVQIDPAGLGGRHRCSRSRIPNVFPMQSGLQIAHVCDRAANIL